MSELELPDRLFASWMPRLYRAAFRMLRNAEDSEDAMQDTLLSAFQHLDQFDGRAQLTTWMYAILLNTARAKLRKRSRSPEMCPLETECSSDQEHTFAVELVDSRPDPEQECERGEKARLLAESYEKLPALYRSAIWLCDVQELGEKEAARRLGLPLGTLKCRLHRARRLLSARAREACTIRSNLYRHSPDRPRRVAAAAPSVVSS